MGRDTRTARALEDARETIAAWALRVAAANKRMAELERELGTARERLSQQQNETLSLKKSLDLSLAENSRLSERLAQGFAAVDKANDRLARARAERIAAEGERDEAMRTAREQIAALDAQLAAMSARAASAEKTASEMRQNLLNGSSENERSQRQIGEMDTLLKQKEQQIQALRQAQTNLLEGIKSRDAAMARAEERIERLSDLFLQLEAKANHATTGDQAGNIEVLLSSEPPARRDPEAFGKDTRVTSAMLRRDLENDAWLFGGRETFRVS